MHPAASNIMMRPALSVRILVTSKSLLTRLAVPYGVLPGVLFEKRIEVISHIVTFTEGSIIYHNFLEVENINFVASNVVLDFELFWQWEFTLADTVNKGKCQFRGLCWWGT